MVLAEGTNGGWKEHIGQADHAIPPVVQLAVLDNFSYCTNS